MSAKLKILYICTHNRCRSQLFEAITRHRAGQYIEARSAGSQPAEAVHPLTLKALQRHNIDTSDLRSKSWDEMDAFAPDVVMTVCDTAAGEACPVWFGQATKIHWALKDPSRSEDYASENEQMAAFDQTIAEIQSRVEQLLKIARSEQQQWPSALQQLRQTINQQ